MHIIIKDEFAADFRRWKEPFEKSVLIGNIYADKSQKRLSYVQVTLLVLFRLSHLILIALCTSKWRFFFNLASSKLTVGKTYPNIPPLQQQQQQLYIYIKQHNNRSCSRPNIPPLQQQQQLYTYIGIKQHNNNNNRSHCSNNNNNIRLDRNFRLNRNFRLP